MNYNQKVIIKSGEYAGRFGRIEAYLGSANMYVVNLETGEQLSLLPDEIEKMQEQITVNDLLEKLNNLSPEEKNMPIVSIASYYREVDGKNEWGYDFQIGSVVKPLHNYIPEYK